MPARRTASGSLPDLGVPGARFRHREGRGYYVEFRRGDRRCQIALRYRDEHRAFSEARDMARRFDVGSYDPFKEKERAVTLADAVRLYVRHNPAWGEKYRYNTERTLLTFAERAGERRPARYVTPADVTAFVWGAERKDSTRKNYHACLSMFFAWALSRGMIEALPTEDVARPRRTKIAPKAMTPAEVDQIIGFIEKHGREHRQKNQPHPADWLIDMIRFGIATGARQQEIAMLRWQDVGESTITFEAYDMIVGTRRYVHTIKNGQDRTIPMFPAARRVIERVQGRSMDTLWVFPGVKSRTPIAGSYIANVFDDMVKEAGMDDRITFHSTRHTFVSWLLMAGVPPRTVMAYTGHSSFKSFEKYAHYIPALSLEREMGVFS